jgi:hypothetical protein
MVGDLSLGGNLSFVGNLDFQWCWKLEILGWVASCDVQEAKEPNLALKLLIPNHLYTFQYICKESTP